MYSMFELLFLEHQILMHHAPFHCILPCLILETEATSDTSGVTTFFLSASMLSMQTIQNSVSSKSVHIVKRLQIRDFCAFNGH